MRKKEEERENQSHLDEGQQLEKVQISVECPNILRYFSSQPNWHDRDATKESEEKTSEIRPTQGIDTVDVVTRG